MKNTIKDTKAMLANAEYYVKTMERTLERGSKYVRRQHKAVCLSCWFHARLHFVFALNQFSFGSLRLCAVM